MKKTLASGGKKASKKNVYIIFTPSKDLTSEHVMEYFKNIESRLELQFFQEPEADKPKIISPLGVAQGRNDVETILLALQESLENELLA